MLVYFEKIYESIRKENHSVSVIWEDDSDTREGRLFGNSLLCARRGVCARVCYVSECVCVCVCVCVCMCMCVVCVCVCMCVCVCVRVLS